MMTDHEQAARIATLAGEALVELREQSGLAGRDLKDTGDRRSHELIMDELARVFPDDAVLSEEGKDDLARLDAERVWIVDPLDGTREYSEGRTDWAVHVALWAAGDLVAGAVALPAVRETLSTGRPSARPAGYTGPPRLLVSRTRPPEEAERIRAVLGGELVAMGSAGAKRMAVVRGEGEIYAHAGGQYEWDSAAPVAVAAACGLHVSRLDGSPLQYNQADVWLPDLLICLPELAAAVIDAVT